MALPLNTPEPQLNATRPRAEAAPPSLGIAQLALLHDEARETALLANLLGRTSYAAGALAVAALAAVLLMRGTMPVAEPAVWIVLMLIGVGAMARNYARAIQQPFERGVLREFAYDLNAIAIYAGFAWGAGAYLVLGPQTSPLALAAFAAVVPAIDARSSTVPFDSAVLSAYHHAFIRPDNLRVVVTGDVSLAACVDTLATVLGDWKAPPGPLSLPGTTVVVPEPGEVAYLIDRPGAAQSQIALGMFAPSGGDVALALANEVFWGGAGSRLDNNLRDAKGWSYGVYSMLAQRRGPRPMVFQAPVQTDRTGEAIDEIRHEITALAENRVPLAETAVDAMRMGIARSLVGVLASGDATLNHVSAQLVLGRPDDFWQRFPEVLRRTDATAANSAIQSVLRNARMTWLIMGDRRRVEGPLRQRFPGLRLLDDRARAID